MKLRSLISNTAVVLFAASMMLTSCTKDENLVSTDFSEFSPVDQVAPDDAFIGNWTISGNSNTADISFNQGTGTASNTVFMLETKNAVYSDFTWQVNASTIQMSYGPGFDMFKTYTINSVSTDQISLDVDGTEIVLVK